uniref:Uncharacterized protein n=1 Tax=Rhipicephalus zambeziensis TaxID=60191 RepID=A0A224Y7A1_9ACAR
MCACVCVLFVRVQTIIVQRCNIFQKDHMQNTFRQASKNGSEAYRRVRAKALFYAYEIAKGKLYSSEHFKVETTPHPYPIVLCKVVACWSLYVCFQVSAWLGHDGMVRDNTT